MRPCTFDRSSTFTHCLRPITLRYVYLLIASAISYAVAVYDDPRNVVGYEHGEVVLDCNRNATGEVAWTYIAPGQSQIEEPIPGVYSKQTTNFGKHSLALKDLRLADAGTYVCRSAEKPPTFTQAGAYVVVMTHKPYCDNSLTVSEVIAGDVVRLTCWAHYVAATNVRLKMSWIDHDGRVLNTNNFSTAATGTSSSSLSVKVRPCPPYLMPHHCVVSFYADMPYADMALNIPSVIPDRCLSPPKQLPVNSTAAGSGCIFDEVTAASPKIAEGRTVSRMLIFLIVCLVLLPIIIGVVCRYDGQTCKRVVSRVRKRRTGGLCSSLNETPPTSATSESSILPELGTQKGSLKSNHPCQSQTPESELIQTTIEVPNYEQCQSSDGPVLAPGEGSPLECEDHGLPDSEHRENISSSLQEQTSNCAAVEDSRDISIHPRKNVSADSVATNHGEMRHATDDAWNDPHHNNSPTVGAVHEAVLHHDSVVGMQDDDDESELLRRVSNSLNGDADEQHETEASPLNPKAC